MKLFFSIGPWLMELFNPPPRDSLSIAQKGGRVLLVTVTLVTLCIIGALLISLLFFVVQRSHEALLGTPQLVRVLTILFVSVAVNVACIMMLFQIKRLDRKLIPERGEMPDLLTSLPPQAGVTKEKA